MSNMNDKNEFDKLADQESERSFFGDMFDFFKVSRKWWLLPIVIVMLMLIVLLFLATTGAAPFIYTLF